MGNQDPQFKRYSTRLIALLVFFSVSAVLADSKVLLVDKQGKYAAISHGEKDWAIDDYLCILQKGEEIACGTVIKATRKGAILKFDFRANEVPVVGDSVVAFEKPDSKVEQKPTPQANPLLGVKPGAEILPENGAVAAEPKAAEKRVEVPPPDKSEKLEQKESVDKEAIDLSTLDESPTTGEPPPPAAGSGASTASVQNPHGAKLGAKPKFKLLYDLWLTYKPGVVPAVTFDTFHNLIMAEIAPTPFIYFGFEVAPSPRYYELDYQVVPRLMLRFGRIYMPFDDLSPHSFFGGRSNVSKLVPSGGSAFLPELWTDLGIGLRAQMISSRSATLEWDLYVSNGFQDSGSDPVGVSTSYPDFANIPFTDNNDDKAVGSRLHASLFAEKVGLGVSAYRCRYTNRSRSSASLWMAGVDGQIHLSNTDFRVGYAFMDVGLPDTGEHFNRGGIYGEVAQTMGKWKLIGRLGQSQNDSRIAAVTDLIIVGATIAFKPGPVQFSLELNQDINRLSIKTNYTFAALRISGAI